MSSTCFILHSHLKYINAYYGQMKMKVVLGFRSECTFVTNCTQNPLLIDFPALISRYLDTDQKAYLIPHPSQSTAGSSTAALSLTTGTSLVPRRKNIKKILTATSEYVVHLILCQSSTGFLHPTESVNIGSKFCLG